MSTASTQLLFQTDPALGLPPWIAFNRPLRVLCATRLDDVLPLLREVEIARTHGQWAAGFVTYEAAPAFDPALATHAPGSLPLVWFGLFHAPEPGAAPPWPEAGPGLELKPDLDATTYFERIAAIKEAIARGETYQVNFTLRLRGRAPMDPLTTFARLHHAQRGGYSALVKHPAFTLCSASPELFFLQQGALLTCRPMKGTATRGPSWMDDEAQRTALQASPKDRAENVMIVDMVRNDLGRLTPAGAVHTRSLFDTQRLPTLWQMTSTVEAQTAAGLPEIFSALFPCASITGAPKVRTTQIIQELETGPRGIYTGALGFAGPQNVAQFNVAIRTLFLDHPTGQAEYGIGSGVVWDSEPVREYEECLSKSMILGGNPGPFALLSTLAWRSTSGYALLDRHLARVGRAALYFGFPFDETRVRQVLLEAAGNFREPAQRVRLTVSPDGTPGVETAPLPPPSDRPWRVAWAPESVDTSDPFLYFKTTRRAVYTRARDAQPGVDDVLLWNNRHEATESTMANLAVQRGDVWITPPVACGLLDGVLRAELLACGDLREDVLTIDDVRRAPALALLNSVRGWIPAVLSS